jgi:hypothetical protein
MRVDNRETGGGGHPFPALASSEAAASSLPTVRWDQGWG